MPCKLIFFQANNRLSLLINAGSPQSILDWLKNHPLPAHARRSAEEIDAAIEAERNAWD